MQKRVFSLLGIYFKSAVKGILGVVLYFVCSNVNAQTGPGGVGKTDGTSNLKIWLTADDLNGDGDLNNNPATGTLVSNWIDKSGNANNFTQTGVNKPSYSTGVFNSILFDTSNSPTAYMDISSGSVNEFTDASVFFVVKISNQ